MTKFVTVVLAVAFGVLTSASALAEGWEFGNWEPPTKAPAVKSVALIAADWGATAVQPAVAPAGCSGMVQHTHVEPAQRAGCSGGGFFGLWRRVAANRQARAQARFSARYSMASGHS